MNVCVLWVSRHPDIIATGYADYGLLQCLLHFDDPLWRVPGGVEFHHHEARGETWPDVPGAVVVLPARHHASPEDVEWFKTNLAKLEWSVVVIAGDEEPVFPFEEIPETETCRTWIMQPYPQHSERSGLIPGGWSPGTREALAQHQTNAELRPLDWFFAGQVTHERREKCVAALRRLDNGSLIETDGYMRGIDIERYRELMASAKVIPCPSGPYTVDTNRPLEAMEAGCIPVCDAMSPRADFDYWGLVFHDPPFPYLRDWRDFRSHMKRLIDDWPASSNTVYSWWQSWKRRIAHKMERDIRAVSGTASASEDPNDQITVLVTTSPTAMHPDTSHIRETLDSIRAQLPDAEILIAVDGVRPEQHHYKADYDEYVQQLLWMANFEYRNVLPIVMPEWGHQANAVRTVLKEVTTPLVLFVEHDTPLLGEINWPGVSQFVGSGEANVLRFHHEAEFLDVHEHLMLGESSVIRYHETGDVPVRKTVAFWARPHVARTEFYRRVLEQHFPPESRTMIEDLLYSVVWCDYKDHGEAAWHDWRLWIYAPEGNVKRSTHLDSRGDAPKYEMDFGR